MPKLYKVWVEIEEIDREEDYYEKYGEPLDVAVFETPEEAEAFVEKLEEHCAKIGAQ